MPRSPPLKRLAAEDALSEEELGTLRDMATELGIPKDKWDQSPSFAFIWGSYAVARWAERLREIQGLSREEAQARASIELGLSEETMMTRKRRFRDGARGL